jgi:hypothetical protein
VISSSASPEALLDYWQEGHYYEVSEALKGRPAPEVVHFCNLLARYAGRGHLDVLQRLMN